MSGSIGVKSKVFLVLLKTRYKLPTALTQPFKILSKQDAVLLISLEYVKVNLYRIHFW